MAAGLAELNMVVPREMQMNPLDAQRLGIRSGERVIVENERGALVIAVRVTPRERPAANAQRESSFQATTLPKPGARTDLESQNASPGCASQRSPAVQPGSGDRRSDAQRALPHRVPDRT